MRNPPTLASPVVVADTAAAMQQVRRMIGDRLPIVGAQTVEQAKALVTGDTPLVLCGCHFDEGRLYDLLRHLKAHRRLESVPFLAIRVLEGELEDALYESVKIATTALGGNGFVDLFRWQRLYGPDAAARQFADAVAALALGTTLPGPLQA